MQIESTKNNTVTPATVREGVQDPDKIKRLREVARNFETLFTSYMLKTMDKTIQRTSINNSFEQMVYRDMLSDEYAKRMAVTEGLGLSKLIYENLKKRPEYASDINNSMHQSNQEDMVINALSSNRFNPLAPAPKRARLTVFETVEKFNNIIMKAAERFEIDPSLVKAMIHQESGGRVYARSTAGAKGLMQLMDGTSQTMGVNNAYDPYQNIMGGAGYLKKMLTEFNGDEELALASYNAGPGAVREYNGIPPYNETRYYVKSVMALKEKYKNASLTGEIE
ncbi:MAG: transglycosylase SLT domain-containing protein [bacterium]